MSSLAALVSEIDARIISFAPQEIQRYIIPFGSRFVLILYSTLYFYCVQTWCLVFSNIVLHACSQLDMSVGAHAEVNLIEWRTRDDLVIDYLADVQTSRNRQGHRKDSTTTIQCHLQ